MPRTLLYNILINGADTPPCSSCSISSQASKKGVDADHAPWTESHYVCPGQRFLSSSVLRGAAQGLGLEVPLLHLPHPEDIHLIFVCLIKSELGHCDRQDAVICIQMTTFRRKRPSAEQSEQIRLIV
ncbi:hypothetical protein AOLI_G00063890 [Acnodon oligacanthus]